MLVVKLGGSKGIDYDAFLEDLSKYDEVILVHGGNQELNDVSSKMGKQVRMVTSVSGYESRYTDRETIELFSMAYCGKVNKMIVEKLQRFGKNAVGLSGVDGRLLVGKRKPFIKVNENGKKKILRDDYTGRVEEVNKDFLSLLLNNNYFPVISPPALSYDNERINVDGDRAAAKIAAAFKCDLLIFSNTPGFLKDVDDEGSLIKKISKDNLEEYMVFAQGRMKKKVMGVLEALDSGVSKVILADARVKEPLTKALEGRGTWIQ
tara:strand:- start:2564 stop:3352 length:789 start_codon:yes stop_codon:yes gene_type:complete